MVQGSGLPAPPRLHSSGQPSLQQRGSSRDSPRLCRHDREVLNRAAFFCMALTNRPQATWYCGVIISEESRRKVKARSGGSCSRHTCGARWPASWGSSKSLRAAVTRHRNVSRRAGKELA
jgi:hypothetical protein